jgi:signal transduction histidine kinase
MFSRYRLSPALHWHLQLLGQLLGEFYAAKLREQKLQQVSYLQAVHETGARLTHDVKNLLQSLNVLCAAAAREDSPGAQELIRRQLPVVVQRLSATLEKLQHPGDGKAQQVPAREWWEELARRYQAQEVSFSAGDLPPEAQLPRALFDSVAENLLANAIAKRAGDTAVRICATLDCASSCELRVCDSGKRIALEVESVLLRAPVSSGGGLGIGLYQAARHAESSGYVLELAANRDGEVCFVLRGAPAEAAAQGSTPAEIMRP